VFQSLTGRLKTGAAYRPDEATIRKFQSLTGRLKTIVVENVAGFSAGFQSLTGRLKTRLRVWRV
jgi:hypothetical protein